MKTKSTNAKDGESLKWITIGAVIGLLAWWPLAVIEGLCAIPLAISKYASKEFNNYNIMSYLSPGNERYIFVTKSFDPKYDTINGLNDVAYYDGKSCSNCGKGIKDYKKMCKKNDNPYVCPNCGKTLFLKIDPVKIKNK